MSTNVPQKRQRPVWSRLRLSSKSLQDQHEDAIRAQVGPTELSDAKTDLTAAERATSMASPGRA